MTVPRHPSGNVDISKFTCECNCECSYAKGTWELVKLNAGGEEHFRLDDCHIKYIPE
jgi:hypothetical protein